MKMCVSVSVHSKRCHLSNWTTIVNCVHSDKNFWIKESKFESDHKLWKGSQQRVRERDENRETENKKCANFPKWDSWQETAESNEVKKQLMNDAGDFASILLHVLKNTSF